MDTVKSKLTNNRLLSGRSYGCRRPAQDEYQYPEGHPCHGCPYTLRVGAPSCMFPSRADGGCFWRDYKRAFKGGRK